MTLAAVIKRSRDERESWRYTSLEALEGLSFAKATARAAQSPAVADDSAAASIVFVNGIWQPALSHLNDLPEGIMQGSAGEGYKLTLAEQMCLVASPLELIFTNQPGSAPLEANTTLRITLGPSARLTLIERHSVPASEGLFVHVLDTAIELGPQAKLVHGKVASGHVRAAQFARTTVRADKSAYYDNFTLLRGGKPLRHEVAVTLAGESAQCQLQGVMLLRDSDHADTTTCVTHDAPHTTSRQVYKSVIDNSAHGVFQGKIRVHQSAPKTDGYQLSRALLLSDQAEMNAKPELEIYADDVKCSHGSTVGDLDEKALFYLRSRGIEESAARALLIGGFVGALVDAIGVDALRDMVRHEVEEWLG